MNITHNHESSQTKHLTLNIVRPIISNHMCYILKSLTSNRVYIGYTINFEHRLRQHNGEISGGAKRTHKGRPWTPICIIKGFYESSAALRFEYRLQHSKRKRRKGENIIKFTYDKLKFLINNGDGSIKKDNKMPWPTLYIHWYDNNYYIQHNNVVNLYNA